ncbi:MAG: aldehyde dehydrogenase family protein, partial [Acidimicrobiia bacterium]|nr:aldehyde dehydrogenase family protein [Acidimicrobiia bacterium]
MITSISPTDERLLAEYEETRPDEVRRHIETASRLQKNWELVPIADRAVPMLEAARLLEERRQELANLMADEMGKPLAQGLGEVDKCAWACRHYAANAERILADQHIAADRTASYVAYRPLGVVLAV